MMLIKRDGQLTTGAALNPNNVWSGSAYEYLKGPSYVSLGIITPSAPTVGAVPYGLLAQHTVGGVTVAEEFQVPFLVPTVFGMDFPVQPDAYLAQAAGVALDRIVTQLRNPTAGTLNYSAVAVVTPAGGRRR